MDSLMDLLGKATNNDTISSAFGEAMSISNATLLLILAVTLVGTNVVANICERQSTLDYVTTFCSLFIGSIMANWLISDIELPVASDLAQSAITANIGMTCAALVVMACYKIAR